MVSAGPAFPPHRARGRRSDAQVRPLFPGLGRGQVGATLVTLREWLHPHPLGEGALGYLWESVGGAEGRPGPFGAPGGGSGGG